MSRKAQDERARKLAEVQAEQQRQEARRRRLSIGGVVAVVLAIVVAGFLYTRLSDRSTDVTAPAAGTSQYGVTVGPDSAPHKVVIYEDFLCPFCGALEKATGTQLAALAEKGSVQVDYRPFHYLSQDYSEQAANAFKVVLDASGAEVATAFHGELFAAQPDEAGPFPDNDWFVEKAVAAGAEESAVRPGIEGLSQRDWVTAASTSAEDTGLQGTPTILLDGTVFTQGATLEDNAAALIRAVS